MKKAVWNKILKIVIAVASAILGALGANAMNMRSKYRDYKNERWEYGLMDYLSPFFLY